LDNYELNGLFGVQEQNSVKRLSLDNHFISNANSTFLFRVGNSDMSPFIEKNDILVVDKSIVPTNGSIIVCMKDNKSICRKLIINGTNKIHPTLKVITKGEEFTLFGVVISLARHIRKYE
jgi:DNA polymerase V